MAYIWGRQAVREAFASEIEIEKVLVAGGARSSGVLAEILGLASQRNITVTPVGSDTLDRISASHNHQGIVAVVSDFSYTDLDDLLLHTGRASEPGLLLVLDHLVDPQNFGTLLRTAEAVGVDGVIVPRERSAGVSSGVVKASAGAVLHLPVAQVVNLARALDALKKRGIWLIGLDAKSTTSYDKVDFLGPVALVVGSEGRGLSRLVRERCDVLARLPMRGKTASLNAATAGSIVLYEILRQRSAAAGQ